MGFQQRRPSLADLQKLFRDAAIQESRDDDAAAAEGQVSSGSAASPATDGYPLPPGSPLEQHHGLQPPHIRPSMDQQLHRINSRGSRTLSSSRASSSGQLDNMQLRASGLDGSGSGGDACCSGRAPDARPLQQYSEQVSAQLKRRALMARALLDALQAPLSGQLAGGGSKTRLPSSALRFCKALAFVKQRKAGLLGGWTWGSALLIQRLPSGAWSAPIFLRLQFGSLGLTMGAQRKQAVYVLQTAEQVAAFVRGSGTVAFDAAMPGELDPTDLYAPVKPVKHQDLSARPNSAKPQCAMITEGLIWDASLRAGYTSLDKRLNSQLYGAGVGPEEVLAGCVVQPPELRPLYRDIEIRAAEAQVVRPAVSKFELARLRTQHFLDWSNHGADRSTRSGSGQDRSIRGGLGARSWLQKRSSSSSSLSYSGDSLSRRSSAVPAGTALAPSMSPCSGSFKLFGEVVELDLLPERQGEDVEAGPGESKEAQRVVA